MTDVKVFLCNLICSVRNLMSFITSGNSPAIASPNTAFAPFFTPGGETFLLFSPSSLLSDNRSLCSVSQMLGTDPSSHSRVLPSLTAVNLLIFSFVIAVFNFRICLISLVIAVVFLLTS